MKSIKAHKVLAAVVTVGVLGGAAGAFALNRPAEVEEVDTAIVARADSESITAPVVESEPAIEATKEAEVPIVASTPPVEHEASAPVEPSETPIAEQDLFSSIFPLVQAKNTVKSASLTDIAAYKFIQRTYLNSQDAFTPSSLDSTVSACINQLIAEYQKGDVQGFARYKEQAVCDL